MATSRRFLSGFVSAEPALPPEMSNRLNKNTTAKVGRIGYRVIMQCLLRLIFNLRLFGRQNIGKLSNDFRLELEQFVDDFLHLVAGQWVNIQVGLFGLS